MGIASLTSGLRLDATAQAWRRRERILIGETPLLHVGDSPDGMRAEWGCGFPRADRRPDPNMNQVLALRRRSSAAQEPRLRRSAVMRRMVGAMMMRLMMMVPVMRGRRHARICKNQKCYRDADYLTHDSIPYLLRSLLR
jgi:hypothetical protein